MSIQVDTNLSYIQNKLGISAEVFTEKYANKSVTEIIREEAEKGGDGGRARLSPTWSSGRDWIGPAECWGRMEPK